MARKIFIDLAPLRESRDFRLLFIGQMVSTLGSQLTVVAIPFQIYLETHSSLQVGLVSTAQLVPLVVFSLIGGSVGDAGDRRLLILFSTMPLTLASVGLAPLRDQRRAGPPPRLLQPGPQRGHPAGRRLLPAGRPLLLLAGHLPGRHH